MAGTVSSGYKSFLSSFTPNMFLRPDYSETISFLDSLTFLMVSAASLAASRSLVKSGFSRTGLSSSSSSECPTSMPKASSAISLGYRPSTVSFDELMRRLMNEKPFDTPSTNLFFLTDYPCVRLASRGEIGASAIPEDYKNTLFLGDLLPSKMLLPGVALTSDSPVIFLASSLSARVKLPVSRSSIGWFGCVFRSSSLF